MAVNRYNTINELVNRAAVEVGLTPVSDVFAANDPAFTQLTTLLTTCVQDLMELFNWQILVRSFNYVTGPAEQGSLDLPADFGYMIPQTGWERSENVPLIGPLSAQDWTYLLGRDLVGSTIYASFRFDQNQLYIFPNDPMPEGLDINFEYISRNLIQVAGSSPTEFSDTAVAGADIVLFPPHLITRMLKMMFLDAKGFDSQKATDAYWAALNSWMGKDNSAAILNAARWRNWYPYLDPYRNLPDTGYGGV
jgi:hypothetical protein